MPMINSLAEICQSIWWTHLLLIFVSFLSNDKKITAMKMKYTVKKFNIQQQLVSLLLTNFVERQLVKSDECSCSTMMHSFIALFPMNFCYKLWFMVEWVFVSHVQELLWIKTVSWCFMPWISTLSRQLILIVSILVRDFM